MLNKSLLKLSKSERIILAEDLWDSVVEKGIAVTADEKAYVKARVTALSSRRYKSRDWKSIKKEIGI